MARILGSVDTILVPVILSLSVTCKSSFGFGSTHQPTRIINDFAKNITPKWPHNSSTSQGFGSDNTHQPPTRIINATENSAETSAIAPQLDNESRVHYGIIAILVVLAMVVVIVVSFIIWRKKKGKQPTKSDQRILRNEDSDMPSSAATNQLHHTDNQVYA